MSAIRLLAPLALASLHLPVAHATGDPGICSAEERPLSFIASEGTFHNVDVSPDGKRIAFDMLGDIHVAPIEGGNASLLSGGAAWEVRPVWSPDGDGIAFISDRSGRDQVHVLQSRLGSLVRPFGEFPGNPAMESVIATAEWMPDANAMVVDGMRVALDRPPGAPLAPAGGAVSSTFHWNGRALFQFAPVDDSLGELSYRYEIRKFVPDTGAWERIGETPDVAASIREAPLVSPDGRWLVYRARTAIADVSIPGDRPARDTHVDTISVRDLRTGETRVLIGPVMSPGWGSNGAGRPFAQIGRFAITPDSRHLIAAYGGGIHKVDLGTGGSRAIPLSIAVTQCMAPAARYTFPVKQGSVDIRNLRGTTLRPDGRQLAFSALRRLYVMDLPDGEPRVLVPGENAGQFQPAYSPDGKWIAFVSWSEVDGGHVWRVPAAGGEPERLTAIPGHYQTPVWTPDGGHLVFVGSDDVVAARSGFSVTVHGGQVQVLALSDRSIRRLGVQAWLGHPPGLSGDGSRIHYAAFSGSSQTQLRLHSIAFDGSGQRVEGLWKWLGRGGDSVALPSPDGRLVAVVKNGNLSIARCSDPVGSAGFDPDACPSTRITTEGALDPRWSFDGRSLEWSFANAHYRSSTVALAAFMDAAQDGSDAALRPETREIRLVVPRRVGKGSVVLSGARLVTMRGDEVIENGAVLVENGRIVAVGARDGFAIPDGATIIDLQGKTILPGFIDAHAHLTTLPRDLLVANHGESLAYLAFGITTAKDPSNGGVHGYAYSEFVETGAMVGPRLFGAEALVSDTQSIRNFDDALGIARRARSLGATFLKYHTGWTRQQRRWIIEAARDSGLNSAAHFAASNYVPGRLNLSTVTDGATSSEHSLDDRDHYSDVVEFLARSGTWLNFAAISTGGGYTARYWESLQGDPRVQRFHVGNEPRQPAALPDGEPGDALPALAGEHERDARLMAAIAARGGAVTVGSHGDFDGFGFHMEMWAYVRGGMAPHAVLRAATLNGAHATGIAFDVGSIEADKIADLVVLDRNPLEDIRHTLTVERVMKDGVLRDAGTLDETWPTKTPLPAWKPKAR